MRFVPNEGLHDFLSAAAALSSDFQTRYPERVNLLATIDVEWWTHLVESDIDVELTTGVLIVHSFSTWRGGVQVALSGQGFGAICVLRTSLEAACYAYLMAREPSLQQVWIERDRDAATKKAFGRAFRAGVDNAIKRLRAEGLEWIAEWVTLLYDGAITFGAHPNPAFIWSHVETDDEVNESGANGGIVSLNPPDSENTEFIMLMTVQHALAAHVLTFLASRLDFDEVELQSVRARGLTRAVKAFDIDIGSDTHATAEELGNILAD